MESRTEQGEASCNTRQTRASHGGKPAAPEAPSASAARDGAPEASEAPVLVIGEVVKLDRGFPLVRLENGELLRCEHAVALVKSEQMRAAIGDVVDVSLPDAHDKARIEAIHERTRAFVRKDPTERALPQVLAANFDQVMVAQPLAEVNLRRLERELVLACETDARVTVVLTKADLAEDEQQVEAMRAQVAALAGPQVETLVVAAGNAPSVEAARALMPPGTTTILIGRSGVGKSSLINELVGADVQLTGNVREGDGKGRHTTVSREIIDVPGGGRIVDMPGVRGLGLWDADAGIGATFADVERFAEQCRFRDCQHEREPGCAVRAAVASGELARERFQSYQALKQETASMKERREQARWMQRDQAASTKARGRNAGAGKGAKRGGKGKRR